MSSSLSQPHKHCRQNTTWKEEFNCAEIFQGSIPTVLKAYKAGFRSRSAYKLHTGCSPRVLSKRIVSHKRKQTSTAVSLFKYMEAYNHSSVQYILPHIQQPAGQNGHRRQVVIHQRRASCQSTFDIETMGLRLFNREYHTSIMRPVIPYIHYETRNARLAINITKLLCQTKDKSSEIYWKRTFFFSLALSSQHQVI